MATFNGEEFLEKQLDSIRKQTHRNWSLVIRDDGSSDKTIELIKAFIGQHPALNISLIQGERKGFANNFLSIVCEHSPDADYYAFSDQDDMWLPKKLEAALSLISKQKGPVLYGSRTIIVDDNDTIIGASPLFKRAPNLKNALVQSFAGGNSMVLNSEARKLLQVAGADVQVYSHDWWAYILISAYGGKVIYDPNPYIYYRSHTSNAIGDNSGLLSKLNRIYLTVNGHFSAWSSANLAALKTVEPELDTETRTLIHDYEIWRSSSGIRAILQLKNIGLHRQTKLGTFALMIASFLGKV